MEAIDHLPEKKKNGQQMIMGTSAFWQQVKVEVPEKLEFFMR